MAFGILHGSLHGPQPPSHSNYNVTQVGGVMWKVICQWHSWLQCSLLCWRSRSRSKVTWYGHFSDYRKIAFSTTNMTGSPTKSICRPQLQQLTDKTWILSHKHIWPVIQQQYLIHSLTRHTVVLFSVVLWHSSRFVKQSSSSFCFLISVTSVAVSYARCNLHTMVPTWACIQGVLKVKVEVKGHVIRALLWCHEMFDKQYLLTFCLYMHSLYEAPLQVSSISVRQVDVMSTSRNELLRHWRSGFIVF